MIGPTILLLYCLLFLGGIGLPPPVVLGRCPGVDIYYFSLCQVLTMVTDNVQVDDLQWGGPTA